MSVENRIDMQVELGMLRRLSEIILLATYNLMPGCDNDRLKDAIDSVKKSALALVEAIGRASDDDIVNHGGEERLEDCSDTISMMLQTFGVCCRTCCDVAALFKHGDIFGQDMSDEVIMSYREDCDYLCAAVALAGRSCQKLAVKMRYNPESVHKVRESFEMVKPYSDELEQLNGNANNPANNEAVLGTSLNNKPTRPEIKMGWGN